VFPFFSACPASDARSQNYLKNPDIVAKTRSRRGPSPTVQGDLRLEAQRVWRPLKKSQEFNTQANEKANGSAGAKDADERQALIAEAGTGDQKGRRGGSQSELEAQILEFAIVAAQSSRNPSVPDGGEEEPTGIGFGKTSDTRNFDFKPVDHLELGEKQQRLFDFEGGASRGRVGFYFLKNAAGAVDLAMQQFLRSVFSQ